MSRSIGTSTGSLIGARVAGLDGVLPMTYVPAHMKNGKAQNQKCTFSVYINRKKKRDGSPGRSDRFSMIAWGNLADTCAKTLAKGKCADFVVTMNSYEGRSFDANGTMRMEHNGQPVIVEKIGFEIKELILDADAQKEIDREIAIGKRPVNWENPSHPDSQLWTTICQNKRNEQYVPGSEAFGNAKVRIAAGPGITPLVAAPAQYQAVQYAAGGPIVPVQPQAIITPAQYNAPAPVAPVQYAPVGNVQQLANEVAAALPVGQAVNPQTGLPVSNVPIGTPVAPVAQTGNKIPF